MNDWSGRRYKSAPLSIMKPTCVLWSAVFAIIQLVEIFSGAISTVLWFRMHDFIKHDHVMVWLPEHKASFSKSNLRKCIFFGYHIFFIIKSWNMFQQNWHCYPGDCWCCSHHDGLMIWHDTWRRNGSFFYICNIFFKMPGIFKGMTSTVFTVPWQQARIRTSSHVVWIKPPVTVTSFVFYLNSNNIVCTAARVYHSSKFLHCNLWFKLSYSTISLHIPCISWTLHYL